MLNLSDLQEIIQANKTMIQLMGDVENLRYSSDQLLAQLGLDIYQKATELDQKLKRLCSLSLREEEKQPD